MIVGFISWGKGVVMIWKGEVDGAVGDHTKRGETSLNQRVSCSQQISRCKFYLGVKMW